MSTLRCRSHEPDFGPARPAGRLPRLGRRKVGVGLVSILTLTALVIPTSALAIGTAPSLGTADPFGVLAASAVTNTGPSTVGGDLGLYPGTSITGFPPGKVLGTVHQTDAVAQGAQSDTTTAYNQAAGEAPDVVLPSNDLTGMSLSPGVYKSASAVMLDTNGTLTLNGEGNPDSVFIFQVGSTLTTGTNSKISYINGAQPCNVFWQVGSSATLGTSSLFVGTILADQSISVSDTVTVDGRLLASNGAVTLIDDTITPADCATAGTTGTTGTGTPVTSPPTTPVAGGSTGTTGTGTPVTTGKAAAAKRREARLARERKARIAKQHRAHLAKLRRAHLARLRKAHLAKLHKAHMKKLHDRQQVPRRPTHHAGFTG